jgi:hypothetical protein
VGDQLLWVTNCLASPCAGRLIGCRQPAIGNLVGLPSARHNKADTLCAPIRSSDLAICRPFLAADAAEWEVTMAVPTKIITQTDVLLPKLTLPKINVSDAESVEEGQKLSFRVWVEGELDQTIQVGFATKDGSAKAPSDYSAKNGYITFNSQHKEDYIKVDVHEDNEYNEFGEYILLTAHVLTFQKGNYVINDQSGMGFIVDSTDVVVNSTDVVKNSTDKKPQVWVDDAETHEGDHGDKTYLKFKIHVDGKHPDGMEVRFYTKSWEANADGATDYVSKGGSVTFGKDEQQQEVWVEIKPDGSHENDERMYFYLEGSSDYDFKGGDDHAVGKIKDDDNASNPSLAGPGSGSEAGSQSTVVATDLNPLA